MTESHGAAALPLARPTAYGIGVRAVGLALGLVVTIFLARNLAADDLGAYQGVLSLSVIVGGLAAATAERPAVRRIAADDGTDPSAVQREVSIAHVLVGTTLLLIGIALLASSLLPFVPDGARVTMRLVALVAPALAVLSLRQWLALPLQGVALSLGPEQIGLPILFLSVAGLAAVRSGLGPGEALAIYAGGCWLVWFVSSWWSGLLSQLRDGLRALPSRRLLRARFREGRSFVLLTAVGILPLYATVPIVAALLDLGDAGRLAIALQLTGLVAVPLQIVSLAIMPHCSRLWADDDTAGLDALVRNACGISLALGLGLAVALALILDPILRVLGPTFAATSALIPALLVGQVVNAVLGPNGPTLQMIGREREAARIEAATMVLRLVSVAVAASMGSIVGVAFAIAATTIVRNVLLSAMLYRWAGILTLPQLPRVRGHRR